MHPAIQIHILARGTGPAEVLVHRLRDNVVPCVVVIPEKTCAAEDGIAHLIAVEVGEGESGALTSLIVVRDDGILQTAGLANDGKGAVTHGDHLGQTTWLEERRHQEHIRAGVHALGQGGIELDASRHLAGVFGSEVAKRVLVLVITGSENGDLNAVRQDAVERIGDKVHALLAGEARDHGHKRLVVANRKAQLLLKLRLADGLAGAIGNAEVLGDRGVGLGVEVVGVDTVDDALKGLAAAAEHAIKVLAVGGRLDLAGVGGGDRGDCVAVVQSTLHEVDGVVAAGELERGGGDVCQAADVLEHLSAELALEGDVVDGEDGGDVLVERHALVELAQEYRCESGMPVVAVQDVRPKAIGQILQALGDRLGEECKALAIIEESIRIIAIEVALVVDKEIRHAIMDKALEAAILVAPAKADVELCNVLHLVFVLIGDSPIERDHDDNVCAGLLQRGGQGARNVAQTAGLDERSRLSRSKDDVHLPMIVRHALSQRIDSFKNRRPESVLDGDSIIPASCEALVTYHASRRNRYSGALGRTRMASGVPRSSVLAGTTLFLSTIAFSTRAPLLMTQSCMMMLLVTDAPFSTITPRDRMELRTVPFMLQPDEMSELHAWQVAAYFAGGTS